MLTRSSIAPVAPVTPVASAQALPLYLRASELLTREIAAGHWQCGERLPTEAQLATQLGMAVGTVRKALAELVVRGLVLRRQGSGTYVQSAAQQKSVYEFFRLELNRGGGLPTATTLQFDTLKRPRAVPAFGDQSSPICHRLRRLRWLNEVPVALEEIWFDARHRTHLKAADLGEALYLFYQEHLGFWIAHVQDHVSVGTAPGWAPIEFGMSQGGACGTVQRDSWAGSGLREEYSMTWFNPAVARYSARWH